MRGIHENLSENAAFPNKFQTRNRRWKCLQSRFRQIAVYFFVTRIIFLNFDMTKRICMEQKIVTKQVFAELLNDFMFKRIFGSEENKDVLIAFLNVMLDDLDIRDVTFIPTEHLGGTEHDRKAIFDISCKCSDSRTFIIEIQRGYQKHFRDRALFYTSYPINEQGRLAKERHDRENQERIELGLEEKKFDWNYKLNPVIVVAILNFSFKHIDDWPEGRYHSSYRIREDITHEPMTENLRFVFMELGRFQKKLWELESRYDKWMYLFKNIQDMIDRPEFFKEKEFKRLFTLARIGNFTAQEKEEYMNTFKQCDYYNVIHTAEEEAREKGLAEGRAEGRAKGRAEEKRDNIRRLLEAGVAMETIAAALELSDEEIATYQ